MQSSALVAAQSWLHLASRRRLSLLPLLRLLLLLLPAAAVIDDVDDVDAVAGDVVLIQDAGDDSGLCPSPGRPLERRLRIEAREHFVDERLTFRGAVDGGNFLTEDVNVVLVAPHEEPVLFKTDRAAGELLDRDALLIGQLPQADKWARFLAGSSDRERPERDDPRLVLGAATVKQLQVRGRGRVGQPLGRLDGVQQDG